MSSFPGSPRILKGGIVLIDPDTAAVQRVIALQYNPDTLTLKVQDIGGSLITFCDGDPHHGISERVRTGTA